MRRVYVATDPVQACLVRALLQSAGIAAEIRGEALWIARGMIPVTPDTAPSVWVPDGQAAGACELIRQAEAAPTDSTSWTCPRCGADVDGTFQECWSCASFRWES